MASNSHLALAPNTLACITQALDAWTAWDCGDAPLTARPELGEELGSGSANTVFALRHAPDLALRVRHNAHTMRVNTDHDEVAVWRQAAALQLAPDVVWATESGSAVVMTRLQFNTVDDDHHAAILRAIHRAPLVLTALSLETTALHYWRALCKSQNDHLAMNPTLEPVLADLRALDAEAPCFCHNDLSPSNLGHRAGALFAIDWEYAAMGSRHFDIATASHTMTPERRKHFAQCVAATAFDSALWSAACRVEALMSQLWQLAVTGSLGETADKTALERLWRRHG